MQKRFTPDEGGVFPEWEEVRLGDIVELKNGYAFSAKTYDKKHDGKYNVLTIANVQSEKFVKIDNKTNTISELPKNIREHQKLKDGDLLISLTGNVGRVAINKGQNNLLNQRVGKLEIKDAEKVDSTFLYYVLNSDLFLKSMKCKGHGTAQKNLSKPDVEEFLFYMPCIEEQRKIAVALAAYDEMIAVKTAKLETWQECKKRMVKEIFGRTKRFKDDDGKSFPEWEEKMLGEVAEINPASAESLPETFYYMDLGSIDSGIWTEKRLVDKKSAPSRAQRIAQQDDVFFQSVRPLNKDHYHYTKKADKSVVASTGFIQLRIKNGSNAFLYQLLYENNFNNEVRRYAAGSNYPAINATNLSKIKVMIPCMEEQQKIGSFLAELDKEVQIQKEFIKTYADGKKRMMMELIE